MLKLYDTLLLEVEEPIKHSFRGGIPETLVWLGISGLESAVRISHAVIDICRMDYCSLSRDCPNSLRNCSISGERFTLGAASAPLPSSESVWAS